MGVGSREEVRRSVGLKNWLVVKRFGGGGRRKIHSEACARGGGGGSM